MSASVTASPILVDLEPDMVTSCALRTVSFVDSKTGWLVDSCGGVFRTIDGGGGWEPDDSTATAFRNRQVSFIHWLSREVAIADAGGDNILRTENGGQSWRLKRIPGLPAPFGIDHSGDAVWLCGEMARSFRSLDQGLTWTFWNGSSGRACPAPRENTGVIELVRREGEYPLDLGTVRISGRDSLQFQNETGSRTVIPRKPGATRTLPLEDVAQHRRLHSGIAEGHLFVSLDLKTWALHSTLPADGTVTFIGAEADGLAREVVLLDGEFAWKFSSGEWSRSDPAFEAWRVRRELASRAGRSVPALNPFDCLKGAVTAELGVDSVTGGSFNYEKVDAQLSVQNGETWVARRQHGRRFLAPATLSKLVDALNAATETRA